MTHGWKSVALACALGGFLGTACAHEIAVRFQYGQHLAFLGTMVGALVSYLAIDFRQFLRGVGAAWSTVIGLRIEADALKAVGILGSGIAAFYFTFVVILFVLIFAPMFIFGPVDHRVLELAGSTILAVIVMGYGLAAAIVALSAAKYRDTVARHKSYAAYVDFGMTVLRHANLVSATWYGLCWARLGLAQVPYASRIAFNAVKGFLREVFILVHSERRLICLVDGGLGAIIGYYIFGSAIAGGIVGAILGVINFEIVSVRWLKIVPVARRAD